MISTFSGAPVVISELLRPLASANRATKTATTSAIVPTVIKVLTRRTTRLRRLYFNGIAIRLFSAFFAVLCVLALSILIRNQNTQRKDAKDRKERKAFTLLFEVHQLFLSGRRSMPECRRSPTQSKPMLPAPALSCRR